MPEIVVLPGERVIGLREGDRRDLLTVLASAGILIESECGGEGTCGKCVVELEEGSLQGLDGEPAEPVSDSRYLACRSVVVSDCVIRLPGGFSGSSSPDEYLAGSIGCGIRGGSVPIRLGVAVDIGTTTVVAVLADLDRGSPLGVQSATNPQRVYGADVISRIAFATGVGGGEPGTGELQRAVTGCIDGLIEDLCAGAGVPASNISSIVCVGNTAMQHLLLGVTPEHLGCLPYSAEFKHVEQRRAGEIGLTSIPGAVMEVLPNIASFVGADTVGCLLSLGDEAERGTWVMVDMGTNTEMVIGSGGRKIACSAAAGPAFEGAKLAHGMRAVTGAISRVWLDEGKGIRREPEFTGGLAFETVGDAAPLGICGSGVVDAISCLLRLEVVLPSGRMPGRAEYVLAGAEASGTGCPVSITRQDVREIQLVKASIATGLRFLLEECGRGFADIDRLYVAGAFGNYLDIDNSIFIGLLPELPADRFTPIGDAALKGAFMALVGGAPALTRARELADSTEHLPLASEPRFQSRFIDSLGLEPYGEDR